MNSEKLIIPDALKENILYVSGEGNCKGSFRKNQFAEQSLLAIGGSSFMKLRTCHASRRVGGSTNDKLAYLAGYKDNASNKEIVVSVLDICCDIFGLENFNKHTILMPSEISRYEKFKYNTFSGTIFKTAGLKKKLDVAGYCYEIFQDIHADWIIDPYSDLKPIEVIEAGSRPKLGEHKKIENKVALGAATGRVISMPSIMEQLIGFPIYKRVMEIVNKRLLTSSGFIAIGIKRHTMDWVKMGDIMKRYKHTYEGDWSKFDQTIPKKLISYGIDVMLSIFDTNWMINFNYLTNFKEWFFKELVDKVYLVDGRVVVGITTGIPSGSLFTSVLGSIINYIVLKHLSVKFGLKDYCIIVYGDDHVIHYNDDNIDTEVFKHYFSDTADIEFGMKLDVDGMKISSGDSRFVTYERPVYEPGSHLGGGTHKLKPLRMEKSKVPFTDFDHEKGTTHRWQYVFKGAICFLKFYFIYDSHLPIRPMIETLTRLINPESRPTDLIQHRSCLLAALCDNKHNIHLYNYIYLMFYDLLHLKDLLITEGTVVDPIYNLYDRESPYSNYYREGPVKEGDRMWFRRMKIGCPFEEHPSLKLYNDHFSFLFSRMGGIMEAMPDKEHYEIKDIYETFYKRGLYLNKPSDVYRAMKEDSTVVDIDRKYIDDMVNNNIDYVKEKLLATYGTSDYWKLMSMTKVKLAIWSAIIRSPRP